MNSFRFAWKRVQKVLVWAGIGACCIFLCLFLWKENAVEELKKIATGIIGSNEEDGVAKWLMENWEE